MTLSTIDLRLCDLIEWSGNVRQTYDKAKIAELKASILAHGLLQSLVVRQTGDADYEVIAGKRRLQALMQLQADGNISDEFVVPCRILSGAQDAAELSLAENVVREPMHPADQFEAFAELAAKNIRLADIANRFGVTEGVVAQRLKLAKVAPKIIEAYRKARLTLEEVQAFAVTDDHARQIAFFDEHWSETKNDHDWQPDDDAIRRAMTEGEIPATDKRARFIGLKAYLDAGGTIHTDMFDDSANGTFLTNSTLLETLVSTKLMAEAERLKQQGWSWVKIAQRYDYTEISKYRRAEPDEQPLTPEDQAYLDQLQQEFAVLDDMDADDMSADQLNRYDNIQPEIAVLERKKNYWPQEIKDHAGVFVCIDSDGRLEHEYGLITPAEAKKKKAAAEAAAPSAPGKKPTPAPRKAEEPQTSQALSTELVVHKTAAIGAAMSLNPHVALAGVVYTLVQDLMVRSQTSNLNLRAFPVAVKNLPASVNPKECKGLIDLREQEKTWKELLPRKDSELFDYLLAQDDQTLLRLLAYLAGCTVQSSTSNKDHATQLGMACNIDMSQWFTPTLENYYSRLSKQQLLAHLSEVMGERNLDSKSLSKMPRMELAGLAARDIPKARPNFLPEVMRIPVKVTAPETEAKKKAEPKPPKPKSTRKKGEQ